jgi:hypothetical protein
MATPQARRDEERAMIKGAHVLFYSKNPEADRAFFRDVLEFRAVDLGRGWLIFALPPAEAAVHPLEGDFSQRHGGHDMMGALVYLMCDDLAATVKSLTARNVRCTEIDQAPWGIKTTIRLPSGSELGLYQPTHETAI